jgi:riboflavin kinase / FMN adenylyltransferase
MSSSGRLVSYPSGFAICRDSNAVPAALKGAVVAIGNFDGVHQGHRRLVEAARAKAFETHCPSAVLTFEPHPRDVFNPAEPLFRLTPEPVKLAVLAKLALDGAFLRRFDAALASLSAEAFVTKLLAETLGVSGVVVGPNFHFGQGREGTPERLRQLAQAHGLSCTIVPIVEEESAVVSSSAIRRALEMGDVARANRLLGYRWFVRSEVRHGDKRGRVLGFPTANLRLGADVRLRHGIYAVRAALADGTLREGVASFGRRPTFDNGAPLLEVFLFDFSGDLYGHCLDVEFIGWIRGEEAFASVEALIAQMNEDAREAKALLAADRTPSMIG